MTSREIADYTGKEHKHILADIRTLLLDLGKDAAEFSATCEVPGPYGRTLTVPIFKLPKRETLILVSGYSVAMRAKIIDRW
jgi:anti-repressor protein